MAKKKEYQSFLDKLMSQNSRKDGEFNMIYGPLTDDYWNQGKKILVCNLETYGDYGCDVKLDLNYFHGMWIEKQKIRTAYNTALFFDSLEKSVNNNNPISSEEIQQNSHNKVSFKESLSKIAYMNLRKISNRTVNQNINEIAKEVNEQLSNLKMQIELLEPNILILGGWQACLEFNKIFQSNLNRDGRVCIGNMHVYSIRHFSRFSYGYFAKKIEEIMHFSYEK
jgi:hypothetical protein